MFIGLLGQIKKSDRELLFSFLCKKLEMSRKWNAFPSTCIGSRDKNIRVKPLMKNTLWKANLRSMMEVREATYENKVKEKVYKC